MDETPAIIAHDIHKEFVLPQYKHTSLKQAFVNIARHSEKEKQQALGGISFEVKRGDFFGIVGRNGSGKSTLLKILAGVYSPTKGAVTVNGNLTPFIELGVGFNPELSGRDNVFLNGALLGFSHKEMAAMYDEIVEFAELEKFMGQKLKNYSSGMQVRLAFAIAVRARTDILLIDEVLAVGDAAFQQKCYNHFEELKRQKKTVVFVSHDMGAVKRFCNKAIYVNNGRLIRSGKPADIADLYAEANISVEKGKNETLKLSDSHSIKVHSISDAGNRLNFQISYKSQDNDEMYTGFAIIKDGISVAELTTPIGKPLVGSGTLSYDLDLSIFNPGVYQLSGVSLFRWHNRELVAVNGHTNEFTIKGEDITRAGPIKLPDSWHYED